MSNYCFRQNHGIKIGNLTPQVVGDTLADIENTHGVIDPHTVVDESRPEDAPLHPVFEWCDEIAAERWRVEQARRVVRSVEIIAKDPSSPTQIAYVNIQSQDGYVSAVTVRSQPDLYQEAEKAYYGRVEAAHAQLVKVRELAPPAQKQRISRDLRILERLVAA